MRALGEKTMVVVHEHKLRHSERKNMVVAHENKLTIWQCPTNAERLDL